MINKRLAEEEFFSFLNNGSIEYGFDFLHKHIEKCIQSAGIIKGKAMQGVDFT